MKLLRTVPRSVARPVSLLVLVAWAVTTGVVLTRACAQARSLDLAPDLARYGTTAQWRGVYYRREKVGFTVSQTLPEGDGFIVQEDARLQMSLLGATSAAAIRTTAHVDRAFVLHAFDFSPRSRHRSRRGERGSGGQARPPHDQDGERHPAGRSSCVTSASGRSCCCFCWRSRSSTCTTSACSISIAIPT